MVSSSPASLRRQPAATLVDRLMVRTRRLRAYSQPFCRISLAVLTPGGSPAVRLALSPQPDSKARTA